MIKRIASALLLAAAVSCNTLPDDVVVKQFLLCDECTDGELLAVKLRGDRAVGPLAAALRDGPSATQIANIQAQARGDRDAAERIRTRYAGVVAGLSDPVDSTGIVDRAVAGYIDQYRERGLTGLSVIGTPAARDSIHQLRVRDAQQSYGWTERVRQKVRAHDLGVFDLRLLRFDTLQSGSSQQARVRIMGHNQNATLTWSSSDAGIVTVSASGMLTGMVPGNATIRVCWTEPVIPQICSSRIAHVQ